MAVEDYADRHTSLIVNLPGCQLRGWWVSMEGSTPAGLSGANRKDDSDQAGEADIIQSSILVLVTERPAKADYLHLPAL